MVPIGFVLERPDLPCTAYYHCFKEAVRRHPWYRDVDAALVIPAEDTAQETNWPRYGDPASADWRGSRGDPGARPGFARYWIDLAAFAMTHPAARVLVLNMDPFRRLAAALRPFDNVILADSALVADERAVNPRTISMPVLPFVAAAPAPPPAAGRPYLVSFQGAASHPIRSVLASLDDGGAVVVRLVDRHTHVGRIDAARGVVDVAYQDLLDRSVFAFVPRGDAAYSHRLIEAMARGAIPVVVSDEWVLPFDRTVDWTGCSVSLPEAAAAEAPAILGRFGRAEIAELHANVCRVYAAIFATLDAIVATLVAEAARVAT